MNPTILLAVLIIGISLVVAAYLLSKKEQPTNKIQQAPNGHQSIINSPSEKEIVLKHILPLKLQAYERVVLFLERIDPGSLIMRIQKPGMSASLLQANLLKAVRQEFEHNTSQQIYLTPNAWKLAKQAKDETLKIINLSASNLPPEGTSLDLAQAVLEMMVKLEKTPSGIALEYIHQEVHKLIG